MRIRKTAVDEWCKRAQIAMILQEKNNTDIVEALGYSRQFVSAILNGREKSPLSRKNIGRYLRIKGEGGRKALEDIKDILLVNENNEKSM